MPSSENKKTSKKQVFDVAKPGKTPAEASARPIIVTHKPVVEDPMVSKNQPPDPDEEKPSTEPATKPTGESSITHGEKVLAPLHENTAEKPKAADEEDKTEDKAENKPTEQATDSTASDINAAAEELNEKKVQQEEDAKESKEDLERQEKVTKLIEEKKYFVKVSETHHRHQSKSLGIIILCLLLVLIGVYIAIDTGLIETDFQLPYEFLDEYFAKIAWW